MLFISSFKCSAVRYAQFQSQIEEDATKSNKYSQSRLKINRKTLIDDTKKMNLNDHKSNSNSTDKLNLMNMKSKSTIEYDEEDLEVFCLINHEVYLGEKTRYSVLDDDEREKEKMKEKVSPLEICCVCLDPLLQLSRAYKNESLCILTNCQHVLHSSCANEVKSYKPNNQTIGSSSSSSSSLVNRSTMGSTTSIDHRNNINGSSAPSLNVGLIKCPICRCESNKTLEAPLQIKSKQTHAIIALNEINQHNSSIKEKMKSSGRNKSSRKNKEDTSQVDEENELFVELLGMGFEEQDIRQEIARSGGDKLMAVNNLLGSS